MSWSKRRGGRGALSTRELVWLVLPPLALGACLPRPGVPRPIPEDRRPASTQPASDSPAATTPSRDSVSPAVAAILDSIEAEVQDSIARVRADAAEAARQDSIVAQARRDSIAEVEAEAARIAEAARLDSIAEAARLDSIETARQDSIAEVQRLAAIAEAARLDSIAEVVRQDSIEAARLDSIAAQAVRDSIETARQDSLIAARAAVPPTEDLAELRALGPSYIPFDRGPRPVLDTEMEARLRTLLLPVVRDQDLPGTTRAYFWLLIRADGTVDEAVLQTSSGNDAFDETARRAAFELLFAPAIRGERAVPAWIVRYVSMVMGGQP